MKVGVIRCSQTEDMCPGTGDFNAAAQGTGAFAAFGPCTVVGFVSCGGCPGSKAVARAQTLVDRGAEAVAVASCITKGHPTTYPCPNREAMLRALKSKLKDIPVLEFTH